MKSLNALAGARPEVGGPVKELAVSDWVLVSSLEAIRLLVLDFLLEEKAFLVEVRVGRGVVLGLELAFDLEFVVEADFEVVLGLELLYFEELEVVGFFLLALLALIGPSPGMFAISFAPS